LFGIEANIGDILDILDADGPSETLLFVLGIVILGEDGDVAK